MVFGHFRTLLMDVQYTSWGFWNCLFLKANKKKKMQLTRNFYWYSARRKPKRQTNRARENAGKHAKQLSDEVMTPAITERGCAQRQLHKESIWHWFVLSKTDVQTKRICKVSLSSYLNTHFLSRNWVLLSLRHPEFCHAFKRLHPHLERKFIRKQPCESPHWIPSAG